MLTLNDGRSELWQWDTGRKLSVDADCSQVHFSNKVFGRSVDVDVVDGIAVIPDILLQTDKELTAWAFVGTAENGYTKISKVFKVNKRNKPADYVFTAPDQTTLGDILDRIEDLEKRPSGDVSEEDIQNAVNEYLDRNPVSVEEKDPTVPAWAKQPRKPTYTAAEVGALPADAEIPILPAFPETASIGQTIVVKAVDENGKPTEWEAADFPSGVSSEWNLIRTMEITGDAVRSIVIDSDENGNPFAYREIYIFGLFKQAVDNTGAKGFVYVNDKLLASASFIDDASRSNGYKMIIDATRPYINFEGYSNRNNGNPSSPVIAYSVVSLSYWGGRLKSEDIASIKLSAVAAEHSFIEGTIFEIYGR